MPLPDLRYRVVFDMQLFLKKVPAYIANKERSYVFQHSMGGLIQVTSFCVNGTKRTNTFTMELNVLTDWFQSNWAFHDIKEMNNAGFSASQAMNYIGTTKSTTKVSNASERDLHNKPYQPRKSMQQELDEALARIL